MFGSQPPFSVNSFRSVVNKVLPITSFVHVPAPYYRSCLNCHHVPSWEPGPTRTEFRAHGLDSDVSEVQSLSFPPRWAGILPCPSR